LPQQQEDLRFLAKQREWTAVLQLIDKLADLAQLETNRAKDQDDFNLRRGGLFKLQKVKLILTNLYQQTEK